MFEKLYKKAESIDKQLEYLFENQVTYKEKIN
jgi:hypothetical protein